MSQHSSPTQSDQEQKLSGSTSDSQRLFMFRQLNQKPNNNVKHDTASMNPKIPKISNERSPQGFYYLKQHHSVHEAEHVPMVGGPTQHLVLSEELRTQNATPTLMFITPSRTKFHGGGFLPYHFSCSTSIKNLLWSIFFLFYQITFHMRFLAF